MQGCRIWLLSFRALSMVDKRVGTTSSVQSTLDKVLLNGWRPGLYI